MENKLLPCPFCGQTKTLIFVPDDDYMVYAAVNCRVECETVLGGCGATGGFRETEEEAIEAWNRRANHGMD